MNAMCSMAVWDDRAVVVTQAHRETGVCTDDFCRGARYPVHVEGGAGVGEKVGAVVVDKPAQHCFGVVGRHCGVRDNRLCVGDIGAACGAGVAQGGCGDEFGTHLEPEVLVEADRQTWTVGHFAHTSQNTWDEGFTAVRVLTDGQ